jgi:hypothetical protein
MREPRAEFVILKSKCEKIIKETTDWKIRDKAIRIHTELSILEKQYDTIMKRLSQLMFKVSWLEAQIVFNRDDKEEDE